MDNRSWCSACGHIIDDDGCCCKPGEQSSLQIPVSRAEPKEVGESLREKVCEQMRYIHCKPNYEDKDIDKLISICSSCLELSIEDFIMKFQEAWIGGEFEDEQGKLSRNKIYNYIRKALSHPNKSNEEIIEEFEKEFGCSSDTDGLEIVVTVDSDKVINWLRTHLPNKSNEEIIEEFEKDWIREDGEGGYIIHYTNPDEVLAWLRTHFPNKVKPVVLPERKKEYICPNTKIRYEMNENDKGFNQAIDLCQQAADKARGK